MRGGPPLGDTPVLWSGPHAHPLTSFLIPKRHLRVCTPEVKGPICPRAPTPGRHGRAQSEAGVSGTAEPAATRGAPGWSSPRSGCPAGLPRRGASGVRPGSQAAAEPAKQGSARRRERSRAGKDQPQGTARHTQTLGHAGDRCSTWMMRQTHRHPMTDGWTDGRMCLLPLPSWEALGFILFGKETFLVDCYPRLQGRVVRMSEGFWRPAAESPSGNGVNDRRPELTEREVVGAAGSRGAERAQGAGAAQLSAQASGPSSHGHSGCHCSRGHSRHGHA